MSVSENLPIAMTDAYKSRNRIAAEMTEITAIYNSHGTVKHALETVSMIEPDSLVYIEAFGADIPSPDESAESLTTSFEGIAQMLGAYRREHGKDERYEELKALILSELSEATSDEDPYSLLFLNHKKEALKLLLEKDCIVVIADYDHFTSDSQDQDAVDTMTARMKSGLMRDRFDIYDGITPNSGAARHFLALNEMVGDRRFLHNIRENFALVNILADLTNASGETELYQNLPRTPDGKVKAYICYGTAHSRSLSTKLRRAGLTVNDIEVSRLAEAEYFDATMQEYYGNHNRRVAIEAYLGLVQNLYFVDFDRSHDHLSELYDGLETLNGNRQELADFCIRCIKIYQRTLRGDDAVEKDIEQLHRQYMHTGADDWVTAFALEE